MFKFNDKIRMLSSCDGKIGLKGKTGTIKDIKIKPNNQYSYAIEFDEAFAGGHDCDGRTDSNRGRWSNEKDRLVLLDRQVDFLRNIIKKK